MVGACGRTRRVTIALLPRYSRVTPPGAPPRPSGPRSPTRPLRGRQHHRYRRPLTSAGGPASSASFIRAPAESSGMTPRVTSRGWNGLERRRVTSPAARAEGGASGGAGFGRQRLKIRVGPCVGWVESLGL